MQTLIKENQVLLDFVFSAKHFQSVVTALDPVGLSVAGGEEEKVGVKLYDELDEIMDAIYD